MILKTCILCIKYTTATDLCSIYQALPKHFGIYQFIYKSSLQPQEASPIIIPTLQMRNKSTEIK